MPSITQIIILGLIIRLSLIVLFPDFCILLKNRIELITPITDFESIKEGLFLLKYSIPPYKGGLLRQNPIILLLLQPVINLHPIIIQLYYISIDTILCLLYYKIGQLYKKRKESYELRNEKGEVKTQVWKIEPELLGLVYYLNPLTVLSCMSLSTAIFNHFFLLLAITFAVNYNILLSTLFLSLSSMISFYPIILIIPIHLLTSGKENRKKWLYIIKTIYFVIQWLVVINFIIYYNFNNWDYLKNSIGTIFFVKDLTPNLGLYWYFFIEMFEQFRMYFTIAFQFFNFGFILPITFKFYNQPMFVLLLQLIINSIFKSYPSIADLCFYLPFLILFKDLLKYLTQIKVISLTIIISLLFSPILWLGWIESHTANANFYYGVTIAYSIAQCFLVSDILLAYRKFEFVNFYNNLKEKKLLFK
ncbi:PIG-U-domain-containing protein [Neoconidiobolus thromboides FSU 785]|nr:PIG-U-domain-containing protein [Neoconidiobolus thromboides FSU 785]